jgi:hypothetical protein
LSTSALVWAVWAIFLFFGALGAFAVLEIAAFRRGKKLQLTTLSETIWAAQTRFPVLRLVIALTCALISISFAFLIVHFWFAFP